jgi:hypothetical protein
MTTVQTNYDRITFSLPNSLNIAIKNYVIQQDKKKLQKAVVLMTEEYENNDELTALTSLDFEDF